MKRSRPTMQYEVKSIQNGCPCNIQHGGCGGSTCSVLQGGGKIWSHANGLRYVYSGCHIVLVLGKKIFIHDSFIFYRTSICGRQNYQLSSFSAHGKSSSHPPQKIPNSSLVNTGFGLLGNTVASYHAWTRWSVRIFLIIHKRKSDEAASKLKTV